MKKYISIFKIKLLNGLQYRAAALAGISTQFTWGFLTLLMFKAFYEVSPENFPMEFSQLSTYIWLQQAFLSFFAVWFFEFDILESISTGNIAYELCRPIDIYSLWVMRSIGLRLSGAVLRCFPVLIISAILPRPYGISPPFSAVSGLLFLVSMALGFVVMVVLVMLIYISTFYTISYRGLLILFTSVIEFLSGALIPIPFFPKALQNVLYLLPFSATQNTPFLIYNGFVQGDEILKSLGIQLFWIIALAILGKLILKHALTKTVIQGG